jgi:4-oxalocrotonate tautomerase
MPIITANILIGRTAEKKAAFVRALTDAAVDALGAPVESVRIIINEMPPEHYGIAGVTVAERNAAKLEGN